jgi:hypothetical protein
MNQTEKHAIAQETEAKIIPPEVFRRTHMRGVILKIEKGIPIPPELIVLESYVKPNAKNRKTTYKGYIGAVRRMRKGDSFLIDFLHITGATLSNIRAAAGRWSAKLGYVQYCDKNIRVWRLDAPPATELIEKAKEEAMERMNVIRTVPTTLTDRVDGRAKIFAFNNSRICLYDGEEEVTSDRKALEHAFKAGAKEMLGLVKDRLSDLFTEE